MQQGQALASMNWQGPPPFQTPNICRLAASGRLHRDRLYSKYMLKTLRLPDHWCQTGLTASHASSTLAPKAFPLTSVLERLEKPRTGHWLRPPIAECGSQVLQRWPASSRLARRRDGVGLRRRSCKRWNLQAEEGAQNIAGCPGWPLGSQ